MKGRKRPMMRNGDGKVVFARPTMSTDAPENDGADGRPPGSRRRSQPPPATKNRGSRRMRPKTKLRR